MQKPLSEMAGFMQKLLPPEIPEAFGDKDTRKGVRAFRDFMHKFYGRLITDGGAFDKPKKEVHAFSDSANIPSSYPFICHVAVFLTNMGLYGILNDNRDTLLLDSIESFTVENNVSNTKIPDTRKIECLRFLTDCGVCISGINISGKKPVPTHESMTISYPENPDMLAGLKTIATAQRDKSTKYVHDILLRCDYRVLENKKIEALPLLKDLLHPLPADVREFMVQLHQDYMAKGYKCDTYVGSSIRFEYFYKSRELWRFNLSLNNGHNITIKASNTHKYPDIVNKLPQWLRDKIAKGYGCGKKMGITDSCDGGCRGYRIKLDGSFMEISDVIKAWIDAEAL